MISICQADTAQHNDIDWLEFFNSSPYPKYDCKTYFIVPFGYAFSRLKFLQDRARVEEMFMGIKKAEEN